MTHDELLDCFKPEYAYGQIGDALRAVVKLHRPDMRKNCDHCTWITNGGAVLYPCPTIQAIEKELK